MRGIALILLCVAGASVGCGQTSIDLIHREASGEAGSSGNPDAGTLPEAGPTPFVCSEAESTIAPGFVRLRQVSSGLCLAQGGATEVGGSPAFEVVLASCTDGATQLWQLISSDLEFYAVRNVAVVMNLDMMFGGINSGTPAVLFTPHGLDNQRFAFRELSASTFSLSPRNATLMCLREQLPGVELWPCSVSDPTQAFEVFDGACLE